MYFRVPYTIHSTGSKGKRPLGIPPYGYSPAIPASSELQAIEYWRGVLSSYGLHYSINPSSIILQ